MYSSHNKNNKNEGNHYQRATCSTIPRMTRNLVTLKARLTHTASHPTSTVLVPAATLLALVTLVVVVFVVVILVSGVTSRGGGGSSRGRSRDGSTVVGSNIVVVVVTRSSSVVGRIAIAAEGVCTTATTGGEVNAIIKETVLSDSNKSGRMVRICVHGAQTIVSGGETIGDRLRHDAVDGSSVDTLKECKDGGV